MAQLSGLLRSVFAQPDLRAVLDADPRPAETPALRVEGPSALRPFLAAALAAERTVLVVTATDREAEDLGAAAADLVEEAGAAAGSPSCRAGRPSRTSASRPARTRSGAGSPSSAASPPTTPRAWWSPPHAA